MLIYCHYIHKVDATALNQDTEEKGEILAYICGAISLKRGFKWVLDAFCNRLRQET